MNADKTLDSASFKLADRKAMPKAQLLWNLRSRNMVVSDNILDPLKRRMVVPNITK